jgi:single-strand DNA-binding protein
LLRKKNSFNIYKYQILKTIIMKNMRNSVQIIGNVGNAPEIREFKGGKMSARFSVATHESFKNASGEKVQNTQWHQVVAWGGMADYIARNVTKGRTIALEGKLSSRSFEDQEGNKRYVTEIIAGSVLLTGTQKKDLSAAEVVPAAQTMKSTRKTAKA